MSIVGRHADQTVRPPVVALAEAFDVFSAEFPRLPTFVPVPLILIGHEGVMRLLLVLQIQFLPEKVQYPMRSMKFVRRDVKLFASCAPADRCHRSHEVCFLYEVERPRSLHQRCSESRVETG